MPPSGSERVKITVSPAARSGVFSVMTPASSTSATVTVTSTVAVRRLEPLWMSVATTVNV